MSSNPFRTTLRERLNGAMKTNNLSAAANALFGPTVDKYGEHFEDLKEDLQMADMDVLYRTYVSKMFLYTFGAFFLGMFTGLVYTATNLSSTSMAMAVRLVIGLPMALAVMVFGFMYIYPSQKAKRRKNDIEDNLPFALNHLSAIATSGIPPSSMFQLLQGFEEYGAISEEAGEISRRVNVFGEDLTTALREVADNSPSEDWSEVLYGMLSTVETGGNMEDYIKEKAEEALFDFKMEREKEIERLSTYASFYTAILIAAPVFLVVILSVMNLLGGQLMGFAIRDLMWMGIHIIIPVINTLFIIFLALKVD
ncbi:MAG: type II secretion system F family protein [Candidatus Nanohaloarchaea archaeon]